MQKKKSILVVDDETPIREWIAACIRDYPEINRIETARNGEEALKLLREHPTDIVLTDITMPRLDGLELLAKLKQEMPEITVIIMSVHNDFEHARLALKNGAYDYILKNEISRKDLFSTLDRILVANKLAENPPEANPAAVDPIMRSRYIQSLLADPRRSVSLEELHRYRIELQDSPLLALALHVVPEKLPEIDRELSGHLNHTTFLTYGKTRLLIIANCDADEDWVARLAQIVSLVVGTTFGRSKLYPGIDGLLPAIREALAQCDRLFYETGAINDFPQHSQEEEKSLKQNLEQKLNQVVEHHRQRRCDRAIHLFQAILDELGQIKLTDVEYLKDMLAMTVHRLFISSSALDIDSKTFENQLHMAKNLTELNGVLAPLFEKMMACETLAKPVADAIAYISLNYMKTISLVDVAEAVHLNEEYFSRLFKKEVGINFTDYLLNLRMEAARSLLMNTDQKVSSIAEQVGINDSKYFSLLFKKTFDQTPSQARDRS